MKITLQINALALEYQREYGTARRHVNITNVSDYPVGGRIGRVFGPGFFEEIVSLCNVNVSPLRHDAADARLVREDAL